MTKKGKPAPLVKDVFAFLGVDRRDCPRQLIDRFVGNDLLIVGSGRCVWDDTRGLPETSNVMVVNDMGMYWPGCIKHWYSNDIDQLIHWNIGRRRPLYRWYPGGGSLHSCTKRDGKDYQEVYHWPFPGQGGSGIPAIMVAIALGYSPITLAGMPFDNSGHFYDPPNSHTLSRGHLWSDFISETPDSLLVKALPLFKGRVRALSGRLRDMLENG